MRVLGWVLCRCVTSRRVSETSRGELAWLQECTSVCITLRVTFKRLRDCFLPSISTKHSQHHDVATTIMKPSYPLSVKQGVRNRRPSTSTYGLLSQDTGSPTFRLQDIIWGLIVIFFYKLQASTGSKQASNSSQRRSHHPSSLFMQSSAMS